MQAIHSKYVCFLVLFLLPFGGESGKPAGGSRAQPAVNRASSRQQHNSAPGNKQFGGTRQQSGGGFNKAPTKWGGLSGGQKVALGAALGAGVGMYVGNRMAHSFRYDSRQYWYGHGYYPGPSSSMMRKCVFYVDDSMPWNVTDPTTEVVVREIVFECQTSQQCCDMSCCPGPVVRHSSGGRYWWKTLLLILAVISIFSCCATLLIIRNRKRRQMQQASAYVATSSYPADNLQKDFGNGFYPQQPYPTNAPPPSYPAYGNSGGYAPAPPAAGYAYPQQYPPPSYPGYQPVQNY